MPFNIITWIAVKDIEKREGKNPAIRRAKIISIAGSVISIAFLLSSLVITLKMLGA